jgi:predicted RNase H-like HicB family nuclease
MNVKVVIEQAEDGRYFIYVPSLPGVLADGATREDAISGIKDAITSYLEPSEEDLPANAASVGVVEL